MDWEGNNSGLEAWLSASAFPTMDLASNEVSEIVPEEAKRKYEAETLHSLRRVHFIELTSDNKPLSSSDPNFELLSLESQLQFRRIQDKFPNLNTNLVHRFMNSGVARSNRLRDLRAKNKGFTYGYNDDAEDLSQKERQLDKGQYFKMTSNHINKERVSDPILANSEVSMGLNSKRRKLSRHELRRLGSQSISTESS